MSQCKIRTSLLYYFFNQFKSGRLGCDIVPEVGSIRYPPRISKGSVIGRVVERVDLADMKMYEWAAFVRTKNRPCHRRARPIAGAQKHRTLQRIRDTQLKA